MKKKGKEKVIEISDNNLMDIINVMKKNDDYLPYCNYKYHQGIIRAKREAERCYNVGCKHFIKFFL